MTDTNSLLQTPIHGWHVAHGARIVDFAGWAMPVQYSSIVEEHVATRTSVGIFDISHMGRLTVGGTDAQAFVDSAVTRQVIDMGAGKIRYALMCNEAGGVLDDVLVYRPAFSDNRPIGLVVNAGNRSKIVRWLNDQIQSPSVPSARGTGTIDLVDTTESTAMIAVQGPKAIAIVDPLVDCDLPAMRYFRGGSTTFQGRPCYLSRTGYTGEDGCEIICGSDDAAPIWETLAEAAATAGGRPCGLGARDTLRLESAMPLYGHELSESINPMQAGLRFAVTLGERRFVGRDALEAFASDPNQPMRIGVHLEDRRIARQGAKVLTSNGNPVGEVTSGTFSPTLGRPIAMAFVDPAAAAIGTQLAIDVRGKHVPAVVVPLPFYKQKQ